MSQILKKILSSFVALTTIAWSVGVGSFALPGVASAAVLSAGDLIKASGPAVYYYAADQKRYVFANLTTYNSWYQDFSSVKTISDAELAAIMIGGNVTIRPGTKLVKITTDPKVYAVTSGGLLHWVESEAIAVSLYGSAWASRVVDVPDAFFVNYSVGSSVSTAVHPNGSLVMMSGSRYVIWDGQARLLSDAAFAANGYNAANVLPTTIVYPMGTPVAGRESMLADTVVAAGVTPVGGSVSVALASDTPAGMTVPKNASAVQLAKYTLTAGAAGATVTGLKFHRVGVGGTTDISNVYLYDANGTRLTTGRTVNSTTNMVEFNSLNLAIPAGQSWSVMLQADFGASSSGGQHSFEVMDAASVVISGTGSVSGSFPVRGNVFTTGNANSARLDVTKGTQPTNPNIGATEAEISNFKLTANTNDIEVRRITLLQAGSISNSDLSNLKLYQGTTLVASAAALIGDKIVLNFTTPYLLTNGTTKTFSLKATVAGRADRTIKTYTEYTTDVYAIDKVYNAGAAICISSSTSGGCSSTNQGSFDGNSSSFISVTTQGGQLTVNFNGPANTNVAKGQQDVVLYKFSLVSPDNQLEIRNLDFKIAGQTVGGQAARVKGSSGTEYFRDIKVKNLDTGATVMGPTSLSGSLASPATDSGYITLTDSFNISPGQIMNLAITADLSNSEDGAGGTVGEFFGSGTSTYKVILGDSSAALFGSSDVRIVNTGEFLASSKIVPNSTINGNNFTVKASSLSISLASTPSSGTVVKKQTLVPSVGLVLTAGAQSDVLVTAMKFTGAASTTAAWAAANLKDVVTSCALFDGATQVGLSQSPDSTLGTMNITNMNLSLARGTSKTLVLKCTTDSVVANTTGDKFSVGIAAAADVTAQDQDSNTVTATLSSGVTTNAALASQAVIQQVKSAGTLTLATDNLRQSTIVVAGGDAWQNFAQFRATAQNEDISIDRIAATSTGDSANFTQVAIATKDGVVKGWDILPAGAYTSKDIDLSQNPITVPKDGSVFLQVWGKLAAVQSSSSVSGATTGVALSGNTASLGIASNITSGEWDSNYNDQMNVRAVGAASGERVYATSTNMTGGTVGNAMAIRKSVPTVSLQTLSSTTLTAGTLDLYKMQVSADPAGSIALKKITFNFSKSTTTGSALSVSNFRLRRGSTDVTLADYSITDMSNNNLKTGSWDMTSSTGQIFVSFTNEETISGSGYVYTLYATVGGPPLSGDSVNLSLARTSNPGVFTGYLTDTQMTAGYYGPNITTSSTATDAANLAGTFVWSDQSEVPHYSASSGSNRSRDWMNDLYVEDLTKTQILSR